MSAQVTSRITCDGPDCDQALYIIAEGTRFSLLRERAARMGWRVVTRPNQHPPKSDFCPACAALAVAS